MLLHKTMQINNVDIRSIKQMFMVVLLHFMIHIPTILNLDLSGYKLPCILNVFNSNWHPE
jgi:hypothetical protein